MIPASTRAWVYVLQSSCCGASGPFEVSGDIESNIRYCMGTSQVGEGCTGRYVLPVRRGPRREKDSRSEKLSAAMWSVRFRAPVRSSLAGARCDAPEAV